MTVLDLDFAIPQRHVLTLNQRLHWRPKADITAALRLIGQRAGRDTTRYQAAHAVVTVTWPDRRRRDAHNVMPTVKALIDGLVDAGVLPDDDDRHLTGPDLRVAPNPGLKGYVGIRIELTPKETP